MRGVAEVLRLLRLRLEDPDWGLAATLEALTDELGEIDGVPLVDTDPPTAGFALTPRLIGTYPRARLELDHYPATLIVPQDSPRRTVTDVVDGAAVFTVRHRVRIFTFVRGPNHEATGHARDRFDLAVDECLHRAPRLSELAAIDPTATTGSKSDVDVAEGDLGTVAGAFLDVAVDLDDTPGIPAAGVADEVDLQVDPPHPALG